MVKHFVTITLRTLRKNKAYSFLNIFGLAIGIACAGLIFLWVEDEVRFDSNNLKKDRIFLVKTNSKVDNGVFTHSSTPGPLAASLQTTIPAIAATCRVSEDMPNTLFTIGEKSLYAPGKYAEPSIFSMFTLPFVQGNAGSAFSQPYSIVLTEKMAKRLFDDDKNIIGKTLRADNKQDLIVTGVIKDLPANSTLQFDWLCPFRIYAQTNPQGDKWENFWLTTYVELKPGVDVATINNKWLEPRYDFTTQKVEADVSTVHFFLFGMKDWRLYNNFDNGKPTGGGRIQYVRLFSAIAWIVVLIACINFMNLATARSEKRAREVGVRKVLGARKHSLLWQFMGEALFMSGLATVVAVLLMAFVLPAFNALVQKQLALHLDNAGHLMALVALALICGLLAGSYPSLYLSNFNPVFVLKGIKMKAGSAAIIRKGLVVLQFTVSIILIVGTIIIYQQIQHVKSRNLGFSKDNLVQLDLQGNMRDKFPVIRQELLAGGSIADAALADHPALDDGNNTTGITWAGKDPNSNIVISQRLVSPEFMSTMGMHVEAGRDLQSTDKISIDQLGKGKDTLFHVLVTSTMQRLMGKGSAVGKSLVFNSNFGPLHLVVEGVVRDYVYGDMYGQPAPVVFYNIPQAFTYMYVRLKAGTDAGQDLAKMEAVLHRLNPGYAVTYTFVDDQFNSRFQSEMLISKLSRVFASLAILISCLGLFGLAAYTAERRIKEIGIRKVLGASSYGIARLLSKDFLQLVLLSCLIAFPVAAWLMHGWLEGYAYRISLNILVFALAGIAAIFIALATVSFQAMRAASANPVESLRND